MSVFTATVESEAEVDATPAKVWSLLSDPTALVRLTPLLCNIEATGELWVWQMRELNALGASLAPQFTEKMRFEENKLISFRHAPPTGQRERIGSEGTYELTETARGVHLAINLSVTADLPLPAPMGPAVRRVMKQTMSMMGDRFAANLLKELGAKTVG